MTEEGQELISRSTTIMPPVMGWNTKDSIVTMGAEYAIIAENCFSEGTSVDLRKGSLRYAHTIGAIGFNVYNVFEYIDGSSNHYLLAAKDDKVWNCTAGGAGVDITGASVINTDTFVCAVNFRNMIFMKDISGTGDMFAWNGVGNITLPAFTGPSGDDKAFTFINSYKNRLYGVVGSSIWYGGINAITGAMTEFDLSGQLTLGGGIAYVGGIAQNSNAQQQVFVVVSFVGEVLVYGGSYPGSSSEWELIGRYIIPPMASFRSFTRFGLDIIVATLNGLVSLSDIMGLANKSEYVYLSDKISNKFKEIVTSSGTVLDRYIFCCYYPNGPWIIISGYNEAALSYVSYVMNTTTKSWWSISGLLIASLCVFKNNLYFGGGNKNIMQLDVGTVDEDQSSPGTYYPVTGVLQTSFNFFQDSEKEKNFVSVKPTIQQSDGLDLYVDAVIDYADLPDAFPTSHVQDDSKGVDYITYQPVCGLTGIGVAASLAMNLVGGSARLKALKVYWTEGGNL